MRLVGFLIAAALLALGWFLYLGYSEPELSYSAQVDVAASPQETWSVFSDPKKMPLWLTGFKKVEYLRGEPNEVGSFYRLTFEENGREFAMTEEVTALSENEHFGMSLESDMMIARSFITFEATGSGTRVTSENTVQGKGVFWRSMLRLSRDEIAAKQQADLEKLKALVETG